MNGRTTDEAASSCGVCHADVTRGRGGGEAQYGAIDPSATLSGLFLDADTQQLHNTTLDLIAELTSPTGAWELVQGEEYEFQVTIEDTEGARVSSITLRDPTEQLVDQATADPPASMLAAGGVFEAETAMRVASAGNIGFGYTKGPNGEETWSVTGEYSWEPEPLRRPTQLIVSVRDMTAGGEGSVPQGGIVGIWRPEDPASILWEGLDWEGKATFEGIARGEWIVRVVGVGPGGACDYEFESVAVIRKTVIEHERVWQHQPITGKVWFKNELEEVVAGDPWAVALVLLQNGQPVSGVAPSVRTSQDPNDGSYTYTVPSEFLIAGDYVLRASFDQTTLNEDVSYPDHCSTYLPQVVYTHRAPGAHQQVEGPGFVFTIEDP